MICPKCGHGFAEPQAGREAVITLEEAVLAYGLFAEGRHTEGAKLMHDLLARPSTNDERKAHEH